MLGDMKAKGDSDDEKKKEKKEKKKEKPIPEGGLWLKLKDDEGTKYYSNVHTNESVWKKPKAGEIWEVKKDKETGNDFYKNSVTKDTTWERPW